MSENLDYKKIVEDLIKLNSSTVNIAFIKLGLFLDKFIDDPRDSVRMEVVKKGYKTDRFIDDKSPAVRREVLKFGIGIEKLNEDKDRSVREEAQKQLAIQILKKKRIIPSDFNNQSYRLIMVQKNSPNGQTVTQPCP